MLLFFLEPQQLVYDGQGALLKARIQFVKETDDPFFSLHGGGLKHLPFTSLESLFTDPEGNANKVKYPVIGDAVFVFYAGGVTGTDVDGPGKVRLGHVKGLPYLPDALVDGHRSKIPDFWIHSKAHCCKEVLTDNYNVFCDDTYRRG
jgi:hypothetical protein